MQRITKGSTVIKVDPKLLKEDPKHVEVDCLEVKQPIGTFYIASIPWKILCDITFFDVRRKLAKERDIERYLGVQRPLIKKRVKELQKYVEFIDATFPTSIIISVEERCATYNEKAGKMRLHNFQGDEYYDPIPFRNLARVLDGQHRIDGLRDFSGENFDLTVSLFVGFDIADQAYIFSTVNLEQTKVTKSLAYDLFALAQSRSPQKTCHNIAVALDSDPGSPFYQRIKRLGVTTEGRLGETITQATFVEAIMRFVSKEPKIDRDFLLRGKNLEKPTAGDLEKLPLRGLFVAGSDNFDMEIADIIRNYFNAIKRKWPKAWDSQAKGFMLGKTNGYRAAMRIFGKAYLHKGGPGDVVSEQEFFDLFDNSEMKDKDFNIENFPPGTSGESRLANRWLEDLGLI